MLYPVKIWSPPPPPQLSSKTWDCTTQKIPSLRSHYQIDPRKSSPFLKNKYIQLKSPLAFPLVRS